jgi:hypothetical protein
MTSCHSVYSSPYPDPQNNTVPDGNSAIFTSARVIADVRKSLVPKDRRDQKLTLAGRDGRPIEGNLNLWLLTRLAGIDYVRHFYRTHFVPHSVINCS